MVVSVSTLKRSGFTAPEATWKISGSGTGPRAATAMIAAATMSTGMTSMMPSG